MQQAAQQAGVAVLGHGAAADVVGGQLRLDAVEGRLVDDGRVLAFV